MIVFYPESCPGRGTGHIRRSLEAAWALAEDGTSACLGAENDASLSRLRDILHGIYSEDEVRQLRCNRPGPPEGATTVVIDSPEVPADIVDILRRDHLVVGLDAGGGGRVRCDYLIDTLPRLKEGHPGNIASTTLLKMPANTRGEGTRGPRTTDDNVGGTSGKVLVSFGGEDARGLTSRCLEQLLSLGVSEDQISVTLPAGHRSSFNLPAGIEVLGAPTGLREELWRFDLVITAFGLTAYEAVGAGAGVLLLHPTGYHRRLARRGGFVSLSQKAGRAALEDFKEGRPMTFRGPMGRPRLMTSRHPETPPSAIADTDNTGAGEWPLPSLLARLSQAGAVECPVCGNRAAAVIVRSEERTHYRCGVCRMVFAQRFEESKIRYDGAYFAEEYRAQYGRSYVEDLPSIVRRGRDRLSFVRRSSGALRKGAAALDVGCAFGAFLVALKEEGAMPFGVDVSSDAIQFCRDHGFRAVWAGDIRHLRSDTVFGRARFDLVTLWFVIEHFKDLDVLLRKTTELLCPGGVLAFSTPNLRGISGRKNVDAFLKTSPEDHATVWSPAIARSVLHRYGFAVRGIRTTGHHPERFPLCGRVRGGGVPWHILRAISRLLGLGDTFEVVAERLPEGTGCGR